MAHRTTAASKAKPAVFARIEYAHVAACFRRNLPRPIHASPRIAERSDACRAMERSAEVRGRRSR